jgi:DNA-binding GntR family transcriptional regulator
MLNYKSLKDHVYDYISAKINDGSLKPKERINEANICENLKVSRTPVREALMQLSSDGYLENLPRRGFIVKEIDPKKVSEIYSIIGCLEGMAATLALKHLKKSDISMLKALVEKMDDAIISKEYNEYYRLQNLFHDTFILASNNSELHTLITNTKKSFIKQSYYIGKPNEDLFKALEETNSEHKRIIELFEEGNPNKLESYLREVHWSPRYADLEALI